MQLERRVARGQVAQFLVVDDVFRRARAVHENHIGRGLGVAQPASHGHQRRDADTTRQQQHFVRRKIRQVELPRRSMNPQPVALGEVLVHPVGHLATRHTLDGQGKTAGQGRRAGNRVGTHQRLAVDLHFQRDELPGLEHEQARLLRDEAECPHIGGFLESADATDKVTTLAPGPDRSGLRNGIHIGLALVVVRAPTIEMAHTCRKGCFGMRPFPIGMAVPAHEKRNGGHSAYSFGHAPAPAYKRQAP
ncbi:hypothetical protein D3C81_952590 [compost metagenome]